MINHYSYIFITFGNKVQVQYCDTVILSANNADQVKKTNIASWHGTQLVLCYRTSLPRQVAICYKLAIEVEINMVSDKLINIPRCDDHGLVIFIQRMLVRFFFAQKQPKKQATPTKSMDKYSASLACPHYGEHKGTQPTWHCKGKNIWAKTCRATPTIHIVTCHIISYQEVEAEHIKGAIWDWQATSMSMNDSR